MPKWKFTVWETGRGQEEALAVICVGIKFYAVKSTNEIISPAFYLFSLPSFSIILLLSDLITLPQLFFFLVAVAGWMGRMVCSICGPSHFFFRTLDFMWPSFVCVSASAVDRVALLAVDCVWQLCVCSVRDFVCSHTHTQPFTAFCSAIYSSFALYFLQS